MRVLIVKTSSMGDILHTLPALTDAKKNFPNISFDWVVEENFKEIPVWHSTVDCVIPIALRRWKKSFFNQKTYKEIREFIQNIRAKNYDVIIDAQGLIKSAVFSTKIAKGKKHGFSFKSAREPFASFFYNKTHFVDKNLHAVERIRLLFAQSLNYEPNKEMGDFGIFEHFNLARNQINSESKEFLVFLHSTTRAEKHWPENYWIELIQKVEKNYPNLKIKLPFGTESEQKRALRLSKGSINAEVLPKMSLTELAQLFSKAKGFVSVDTGLAHLAATMNKPNIILYGKTNPKLIGTYGKNQIYLCSSNQSLNEISPEKVYLNLSEQILDK